MQVNTPQSYPTEKRYSAIMRCVERKTLDQRQKQSLTISLLRGVVCAANNKLPFICIRQRTLFLILVFIFDVLQNGLQIMHPIGAHRIVKLNAFFLHVGNCTNPMHLALVNGEDYLIKTKNVLALRKREKGNGRMNHKFSSSKGDKKEKEKPYLELSLTSALHSCTRTSRLKQDWRCLH